MRRVMEDVVAQELSDIIEINWDNQPINFHEAIELESETFVEISGTVKYLSTYEEDTNSTYMEWVDVDIDEMEITQYRDDEPIEPTIHLNETFIKKYLEQYLMSA